MKGDSIFYTDTSGTVHPAMVLVQHSKTCASIKVFKISGDEVKTSVKLAEKNWQPDTWQKRDAHPPGESL